MPGGMPQSAGLSDVLGYLVKQVQLRLSALADAARLIEYGEVGVRVTLLAMCPRYVLLERGHLLWCEPDAMIWEGGHEAHQ